MKTRNYALDIAKAIGIVLVIVYHSKIIPQMSYRSFNMPLFFLLAGYLSKPKDIKDSLRKDLSRLMLPYLYTCLAIVGICLVKSLFKEDYWDRTIYYIQASFIGSGSSHSCMFLSGLPIIGAIWFFPALYVCKNTYNCLQSYSLKKRLMISSVIFVVATIVGRYLIFIPFSVLSGLSAIIFFAIGDAFKVFNRIRPIHWAIGIACWIVALMFSRLSLVRPMVELYFIDVIGATTASLLVYLLSQKIEKISVLSKCMIWIGQNTLYILCFHLIDLNVVKVSKSLRHVNSVLALVAMILFPIIATYVFVNLKKWIKERRSISGMHT